jgi:hypothetical protein
LRRIEGDDDGIEVLARAYPVALAERFDRREDTVRRVIARRNRSDPRPQARARNCLFGAEAVLDGVRERARGIRHPPHTASSD